MVIAIDNYNKLLFYVRCDLVSVYLLTVRLAGSMLPYEGRLEVYHDGVWGTVCDDDFNDTDADVACYSLGFRSTPVLN